MSDRALTMQDGPHGEPIDLAAVEVVLVSSGHAALDHRVFEKEAVSLARYFPNVRVVAAHAGDARRAGIAISGLPASTHRWERFLLRPLRCLRAARGACCPRVLILHDVELLWWAPLMKRFTDWRIIYDVHEDFGPLMLRRQWIPRPLRALICRGLEQLERWCAAQSDGIIGVTETLVDKFSHPRRIALYNLPGQAFIEQAAEQARPLAERRYDLVHLGTLSAERATFLGEVLAAHFARYPQGRALLIGIRPEQRACFGARFSAERVTMLETTPYQEISGLLADCRIGINIHPVLYPHLRCAVPVKVFEYMAAGAGVVTSYLPELHRLLGDDGAAHVITVETPAPERFAEEISRLLQQPDVLQQHQQALMQLIRTRWHWEAAEQRFRQFVLETFQQ